jgi:hypothetical protein
VRILKLSAKKSNPRLGQCYVLAGRFISSHEGQGAALVHGKIHNPFRHGKYKELDHAWIEKGGRVWEPTTDRWYEQGAFNALYQPIIYKRYSQEEVWKTSVKQGHWGPWH